MVVTARSEGLNRYTMFEKSPHGCQKFGQRILASVLASLKVVLYELQRDDILPRSDPTRSYISPQAHRAKLPQSLPH